MADGGKVVVKIDGDTKGFEGKFDKIKSFAGSAAKGIAAGFTAAAAGVGAIGTAAVKAYADYEQLVGGVETLFGARSTSSLEEYAAAVGKSADKVKAEYEMVLQAQDQVMQDASNAYKTAGLSANEYMETATMLAASLNQSSASQLDSANLANMAITDMADNANKMGTSMEMIQNAYQGFSKQNYTMLDNLKLGYGGTKTEMERLLADAEKLSGVKYDISSLTDIVEAIHVIQTEQGITGTTAKEAATTIQGSLSMVKASWENLVTGLADSDADVGSLMEQVIVSAETFLSNVIPVVKTALNSIGQTVSEYIPVLAEKIPTMLNDILPGLLQAAANIAAALAQQAPAIFQVVVNAIVSTLGEIGTALAASMPQLSGIFENLVPIVGALTTAFVAYKVVTLATAAAQGVLNAVMALNPIGLIVAAIAALVAAFVILWNKSEAFRNFWIGLWEGIKNVVLTVVEFIKENWKQLALFLVNPLAGALALLYKLNPKFKEWVDNLISGIQEWFTNAWTAISTSISSFFTQIVTFFTALPGRISNALSTAITAIATWGTNLVTWAQTAIPQFIESVVTFFSTLPERIGYALGFVIGKLALWATELYAWATTAIPAFIDSIVTFFQELPGKIKEKFDEIINNIREWGANLLNWAQTAIPQFVDNVKNGINDMKEKVKAKLTEAFEVVKTWGQNLITWATTTVPQFVNNVITKIKELPGKIHEQFTKALNKVKEWGNNLKAWAQATIPSIVNSIVTFFKELPGKMLGIGKDIVTGLWNGITGAKDWLAGKVKGFCDNVTKGFRDAFKIGSPSKVMRDEVGRWLAEGIAVGVEGNIDKIVDALSSLTKDTRTEVQKVIDESNKQLLDSEKFYNAEKERLSSDSAKTQEQIAYESEKKRQKYLKKQTDDEKKANDEKLEQLKSAADEANENQKKANEKYLANLKETAEKERKLYDAMQKDIANSQNEIISAIATFAQKAKKSIEDVQKEQESYAKKLKGYVSLYDNSTGTFTDFGLYAEQMGEFADAMALLKEKKDVPDDFFAELRDLPVEKGIALAKGLANAPEHMYNVYMDGWKLYQEKSEYASKTAYQKEAQNAADEVITAFEDLGTQLDKIGENNAEAWANGFAEKVKAYIPELMNSLFGAYSDISSGGQLAFAAPQGNIYNNSYYVQPSSGESTQQQIWALRNAQFLNEQRGY